MNKDPFDSLLRVVLRYPVPSGQGTCEDEGVLGFGDYRI